MTTNCYKAVNIPGPRAVAAADGAPGDPGKNSFTTTLASFVVPDVDGEVIIEVEDTSWMVPSNDIGTGSEVDGQVIVIQFAGSFLVSAVVDSTHAQIYNIGYPHNAPSGTEIPIGSKVGVGGLRGDSGAVAGGGLQAANNLSDVADTATALTNLGIGNLGVLDQVTDAQFSGTLSVSHGGTGGSTQSAARTGLGLGSIATQDASSVSIAGGNVTGLALLTGTVFSCAILNTTGDVTMAGKLFTPATALQSLLAASPVNPNAQTVMVVGNGGPQTITAVPSISIPASPGQRLRIIGTDDTNTVTLQTEASLAGSKLKLGASTRALGKNDVLDLEYLSTGFWVETHFVDNPA